MKARNLASKYPHMTEHERAAVVLYTMEDYPRENSPYFVMNRALREKNRLAVRPWRDYVWLLMHGMRKIPEPTETSLIRGCKSSLTNWGSDFQVGHTFQWAAFSSTATKIEVMKEFLGTVGERTLFTIKLLSPSYGRSLQDFSLFPDESEVLLAPGCTFKLTSLFDAGHGLTMIQCEQVMSADEILDLSPSNKPSNAHANPPAPKKEAKPVKAQPQPPISSEWTNVLQHFVIDELRALHESLFDSKGGAKNKQQLVDAVCSHSSGIDILKKQSVRVNQLRDVLVQKASLSEQEAKALSKEDIIEKLRRGELRVPAPAPKPAVDAADAALAVAPTPKPAGAVPDETTASAPKKAATPIGISASASSVHADGKEDSDTSSADEDAKVPKGGKKKKKAHKDPNAPKQALTPYILFSQAERENVRIAQ